MQHVSYNSFLRFKCFASFQSAVGNKSKGQSSSKWTFFSSSWSLLAQTSCVWPDRPSSLIKVWIQYSLGLVIFGEFANLHLTRILHVGPSEFISGICVNAVLTLRSYLTFTLHPPGSMLFAYLQSTDLCFVYCIQFELLLIYSVATTYIFCLCLVGEIPPLLLFLKFLPFLPR